MQIADRTYGVFDVNELDGQLKLALALASSQQETKRIGERSKRGQKGKVLAEPRRRSLDRLWRTTRGSEDGVDIHLREVEQLAAATLRRGGLTRRYHDGGDGGGPSRYAQK